MVNIKLVSGSDASATVIVYGNSDILKPVIVILPVPLVVTVYCLAVFKTVFVTVTITLAFKLDTVPTTKESVQVLTGFTLVQSLHDILNLCVWFKVSKVSNLL